MLHIATEYHHQQVVQELLEMGASTDIASKVEYKMIPDYIVFMEVYYPQNGNTPIFVAANNGDKAIVELLIQKEAKLATANHHGDTALHRAARHFHLKVVELLVQAGAPLHSKNNVCLLFIMVV